MRIIWGFRDCDAFSHRSHAQKIWISDDASSHHSWFSSPDTSDGTTFERSATAFGTKHCWTDRLELSNDAVVLGLLHVEPHSGARLLLPIPIPPVICNFDRTKLGTGSPTPSLTQCFPSLGSIQLRLSLRSQVTPEPSRHHIDSSISSRISGNLGASTITDRSNPVLFHVRILWCRIRCYVGKDGKCS